MNRDGQINWINNLAQNIADYGGEGTAVELVDYALSPEGQAEWGITVPAWFDDHDRYLLIVRVGARL